MRGKDFTGPARRQNLLSRRVRQNVEADLIIQEINLSIEVDSVAKGEIQGGDKIEGGEPRQLDPSDSNHKKKSCKRVRPKYLGLQCIWDEAGEQSFSPLFF